MSDFATTAGLLTSAGRRLDGYGWLRGTSGNLSAVLDRDPLRLAITRSGTWKGDLTPDAFLEVDDRGAATGGHIGKPSAETLLHVAIARARGAGAVVHTHSVWGTVLSAQHFAANGLAIEGYEMLKGLEGVATHEHREWVPILDNDQDMPRLAGRIDRLLAQDPSCHAFLLRRHGLYTWGSTLPEAIRHVEIIEFLLEAVGRSSTSSEG